ncbi:MAG TPA: S-layer homology domain-containing protein [Clostridiales bacterium]|nr:S-layer homology domain-containing protein [Clostridiales bacterium]
MKVCRNYITMLLVVGLMFIFSTGVFAENHSGLSEAEQAMTEATAMVVDEENNTITYVNPDETTDVNVKVYEKFNDVTEDAWYENYLSHLVQLGIINGVSADQFAPNDDVTRAQFATILAYASNADLTQYEGVTSFRDVSVSAWYAPQVEWAYQQGLINGRGDGLFCPESYITREEAASLVNRYAESEDSRIFEDNQYELNDDAKEYLTASEVTFLEEALSDPVYADEEDISSWADDEVDAMSVAGIFCGDKNHKFHPQDSLKRSECVKIISAYIINDTKPTFYFPGGSYIEYLGTADTEDVTYTDEELAEMGIDPEALASFHDSSFYCEVAEPSGADSGSISASWAPTGHQTITSRALTGLKDNTGEGGRAYIYNKFDNDNTNGQDGLYWIKYFAWYADVVEEYVDGYSFPYKCVSHFYDPTSGLSYLPNTYSTNAYRYFNDHYYNAYTNYRNGDKYTAYTELGLSIHYLEDLNNPYHASNQTAANTLHLEYEAWADNSVLPHANTSMTYDSYRYVYDSTAIAMANNFAGLAKGTYYNCSRFKSVMPYYTPAWNDTVTNITRTERAVTGLLNRFYYNGWLNH